MIDVMRRHDALMYSGLSRSQLCDSIARMEADMEALKAVASEMQYVIRRIEDELGEVVVKDGAMLYSEHFERELRRIVV